MISRITNYVQAVKRCITKKTHFFTVFLFAFFVLYTNESSAHNVVLSVYKLKYENDNWVLYFQQKTRSLRDAIYSIKSDLKGINLNSEIFLNETKKYITNHFRLENNSKKLAFTTKHMRYNGRNFEGQFFIEGLSKYPKHLNIKTSGFDEHEHSMKILSILTANQEYLHNFNQAQKQAIFSFDSKQYLASVEKTMKTKPDFSILIYIAGGLIALIIVLKVVSWNVERKTQV